MRGVVLAGGASSRMGRSKAALPLTDRTDTFLSRLLRTLTAAGLPEIVVVTGGTPDATRAAAGRIRRQVRFLHNPQWMDGQLSSLRAGLTPRPGDVLEAVVVSLVDTPLVSSATVVQLMHAWRHSHATIVRPARGDEHGHPVLFDACLFGELRAADPATGAKPVVHAHQHETLNLAIDDPGAFTDIDTETDYRAALLELRS